MSTDSLATCYQKKQRKATKKGCEGTKISPKRKKREYKCKKYKNLPEDEKQSLAEHRKNYFKKRKNTSQ